LHASAAAAAAETGDELHSKSSESAAKQLLSLPYCFVYYILLKKSRHVQIRNTVACAFDAKLYIYQ
jgi:hypothetical protein